MSDQYTCPGCSRSTDAVAVVGIGRFGGGTHKYALCAACAEELKADPQPVLERVELALARPKGNA